MADVADSAETAGTQVSSSPAAASTPAKKTKAAKVVKAKKSPAEAKAKTKTKPKSKPVQPATSEMVLAAIGDLDEKGGSSLQAIKKYIITNYKVDADRRAPFIKRYIRTAVESGALIRTKGKGAVGSFKLEGKGKPKTTERTAKAAVAKKKVVKKSPIKKKTATGPRTPAKVRKTVKAVATPKKTKPKPKKAKSPAKKTKSPKKGVSPKSKSIKKAKK